METSIESTANVFREPDGVCPYVRVLSWIIASNMSLLTTKYLLTNGYNYPLHLLLAHLAAAIALETVAILLATFIEGPWTTWTKLTSRSDRSTGLWIALRYLVYPVTTAAATMLGYQALQHFGTFPAMVVTLTCVTQPWDIYRLTRFVGKRDVALLALFIVSILSVYLLDAKLDFKGVGSAFLAFSFATAAKAQERWLGAQGKSQSLGTDAIPRRMLNLVALIIALGVAALSCWKWETPIYSPLDGYRVRWVLIMNIGGSALAFRLGWPPFWMLRNQHDTHDENPSDPGPRFSNLPSWIAMATTSTASAVFHMGFPMNKGQYAGCFFMLESLLAMQKQSQTAARQSQALEEDDVAHMSLLSPEGASIDLDSYRRTHDLEWTFHSKSARTPAPRPRTSYVQSLHLPIILRAILMLFLWLGPTYVDVKKPFSKPQESWSRLQNDGHILSSLDLVVSYYDESVSEMAWQINELVSLPVLSQLDIRVIMYNKGNTTSTDLRDELVALTGLSLEVVARPNVGKESETYLHHMVSRWDTLASHTFFMQAHMHNILTSQQRITQYFVPQTGFLPLSPLEACSSFEGCTDHSTWSEESQILKTIFHEANVGRELEAVLLTYRGQFIASASQIRANGQQHYLNLLNELCDEDSYTHSIEYAHRPWMPGKEDEMTAPLFGYTIERMWPAILGCSELRLLRNCPSLTSGWLRSFFPGYSVRIDDCQCVNNM